MIHRQQLKTLHNTVRKRLYGISLAQGAGGMAVSVESGSIGLRDDFLQDGG
jgi:hypothetical protein